MGTLYATNIVWDTDGETVELPTSVRVPQGVEPNDMADMLSDTFGWCVASLTIETR